MGRMKEIVIKLQDGEPLTNDERNFVEANDAPLYLKLLYEQQGEADEQD